MEQKKTCLWLKGLPLLVPTNNVYAHMLLLPKRERESDCTIYRRAKIDGN
jgi:hypothetical protein